MLYKHEGLGVVKEATGVHRQGPCLCEWRVSCGDSTCISEDK